MIYLGIYPIMENNVVEAFEGLNDSGVFLGRLADMLRV
jgi:hypothetical protein